MWQRRQANPRYSGPYAALKPHHNNAGKIFADPGYTALHFCECAQFFWNSASKIPDLVKASRLGTRYILCLVPTRYGLAPSAPCYSVTLTRYLATLGSP